MANHDKLHKARKLLAAQSKPKKTVVSVPSQSVVSDTQPWPTFDEEVAEQTVKNVDKTINGYCSGCGGCCTAILPWTIEEAKQIRVSFWSAPQELIDKVLKNVEILRAAKSSLCMFLDVSSETHRPCLVYNLYRPSICKTFCCGMDVKDIVINRHNHNENAFFNKFTGRTLQNLCSTYRIIFCGTKYEKDYNIEYDTYIYLQELFYEQFAPAMDKATEEEKFKLEKEFNSFAAILCNNDFFISDDKLHEVLGVKPYEE